MSTDDERIYCHKCGVLAEHDARYCHRCGSELPQIAEATLESQVKPIVEATESNDLQDLQQQNDSVVTPEVAEISTISHIAPQEEVVMQSDLSESDMKFLNGFTLAPCCFLYLFSRAFWMFAVLTLLVRFVSTILTTGSEEAPLEPDVIIIALVLQLIVLAFLLWLGKTARRLRWQKLKWDSFFTFEKNEKAWEVAGIIALAIGGLYFLQFLDVF